MGGKMDVDERAERYYFRSRLDDVSFLFSLLSSQWRIVRYGGLQAVHEVSVVAF